MQLSDRVWNLSKQYKQELEESISVAIEPGISAIELAAKIKPYLNEPNKRFRRIRDKFGVLQLSDNALAYHPGRGVYRSSARNAQRLARTEINMAYRTAEQLRWSQMDFVVGYEVKLTQNGKHVPDICDELIGKYPKEFKFSGWHPHCLCYTIPILKTEDEFFSLDDTKPSINAVTDTPVNFKQWVRDNKDRIEAASERGKLPYFLRDNMDAWGKVAYPDKYKNKPTDNEFKLLPLPLIAKDATESDIANLISILGHNNHWFDHLDNKVLFKISDKTNRAAGANRETATISIEYTRFPTLRNALHNLTSGHKLSEGEAENIATLWHEMNHLRHIGIESAGKNITRRAMELANEWYTRQTLPDFYSAFGLDKVPYPKFMNTRPANLYDGMVRRFDAVIKNMGLDKQSVFSVLENGLFNRDYSTQLDVLKDALIAGGLKSTDKFHTIEKLINNTIISSVDAPLSLKTVSKEVLDKMGFVKDFSDAYRGNLIARIFNNIETFLISKEFRNIGDAKQLQQVAEKLFTEAVGNEVKISIQEDLMSIDIAKAHLTELLSIVREYDIKQGRLTDIILGYIPEYEYEQGNTVYTPNEGSKKIFLAEKFDSRDTIKAENNSRCDKSRFPFSLASHEGGHLLFNFNAPRNLQLHCFADEISKIYTGYTNEIYELYINGMIDKIDNISIGDNGSSRGISEFFAECFQEFRNSKNPSKYALLVGNAIQKFFKK